MTSEDGLFDGFEVGHARLTQPFRFGTAGDRDTVGTAVRDRGLAAYEAPVTDILVELCKARPGVVLDVGANTGLYALTAAAADPSIKVIAFEPLDPVRALLERNLRLNPRLAERIAVHPVGLSNRTGVVRFFETINDQGLVSTSSSLEQEHIRGVGGIHVERLIRTVVLDGYGGIVDGEPIALMKIDVEGHEHAVLAGARRCLATHRPFVTIEMLGHGNAPVINDILANDGYVPFGMAQGALRQREAVVFDPEAWNYLLVPAERLAAVFGLCRRLDLRLELR